MITKFNYKLDKGIVKRISAYTFTTLEELEGRLSGVDNTTVIDSIVNTTIKGESERELIAVEDEWFSVQDEIQKMDLERINLENQLNSGKALTADEQLRIKARIAELKEGTLVVEKEFYDHYTRKTHKVKEVHQTPYTKKLESRNSLESINTFLKTIRGAGNENRPLPLITKEKEQEIRKIMVRQKINISVGDMPDLVADLSNALNALIKKTAGNILSAEDEAVINKYKSRQTTINDIVSKDYIK